MPRSVATFSPAFEAAALAEVGRRLGCPPRPRALAPGVAEFEHPDPFPHLAEPWRQRPPVYLHHLFPAEVSLPVAPRPSDLLRDLKQTVRALARRLPRGETFAVQARVVDRFPCTLASVVEDGLERLVRNITRNPVDVRRPCHVLSVFVGEREAALGISPPHLNLTPWAGGVPPLLYDPARINRAELKLLEAFMVFGLRPRPGRRALDLGACPGGWTRVLLQHGLEVEAVGPGDLDPRLHRGRVRHRPVPAEDYLGAAPVRVDAIFNDMYVSPEETARVMTRCAPLLRPGGWALVTLKLGRKRPGWHLGLALEELRRAWRVTRLRQLHFNRNEVTAWLRPPKAGT